MQLSFPITRDVPAAAIGMKKLGKCKSMLLGNLTMNFSIQVFSSLAVFASI